MEIAIFFLWGRFFSTIFNAFYEQCLNCIFSVHAICTAHNYFIIVTHTLHLSEKNIIMCFRLLYLPPLSQLPYLFTNELSASGIVVLCSDQKFLRKIHMKIEIAIFSKITSKLIENKKSRIMTSLLRM